MSLLWRYLPYVLLLFCSTLSAQVTGIIQDGETGEPLPFATLRSLTNFDGVVADKNGAFTLPHKGRYEISYTGYLPDTVDLLTDQQRIGLVPSIRTMDAVVVSGTRTFKRQTRTPVIVSLITKESLEQVQACNLADGLRFQPGLRIETDCQTCNYTQLRMNGLGGGYSQILVNGRPIFSPLTGLYGMEQLPANMIERIEVVRGGGSVLYGSGAIGGTVNVITRLPTSNTAELSYLANRIGTQTTDHQMNGNATVIHSSGKAGASFFLHHRDRQTYDHNGDEFSELPALKNQSFGTGLFFTPTSNQKLEVSLSALHEYRYGGEMVDLSPHLAQQSEERVHDVLMGSADYQINFQEDRSSVIAYIAGQSTQRDHYTGILPDDPDELQKHLEDPPYGRSDNTTFQGGLQVNHELASGVGLRHVLTLGSEFVTDDVFDEIQAYQYQVDQRSQNLGVFVQSDWQITPSINVLTGLRMDQHNRIEKPLLNPRIAVLYRLQNATQFRLSWGTGFRAPQAFDADLHIAFAGGGVSRITLDPDLHEERSQSVSGSINYDHADEHWVAGFTLEGFYTRLTDAFYLAPDGSDNFGQRFIKRNGSGSTVQGLTLELRANLDRKIQIEAGMTYQSSLFDTPVTWIEDQPARRPFLRTPNEYGYATLSLFPLSRWKTSVNVVYTGTMAIAHFAGAPEQSIDLYKTTPTFLEWSLRTAYTFPFPSMGMDLETFIGVRNLTNAYQHDFDTEKKRDSNYVYGPGMPRTIYGGVKISFGGSPKG
ncbi:MAG: TonB-dependent receptor [Saprospiraceae bacterium]|nr:TonB-dependent receptor [Saprospiraceae bacterium]